jgi:hypothetical protein
MAIMRFRIPNASDFDPRFWQAAFVAGIDGRPLKSKNKIDEDILILDIDSSDSCKLSIPWPTKDFGPVVLTTASLRSNQPPYDLTLELARGTLHRIRTNAFFWDRTGVRIPNSHSELIDQASDIFVQAILEKENKPLSDNLAQQAIDLTVSAARPLVRAYVTQNLHARLRNNEKLQTLFGVRLPNSTNWKHLAEQLLPACNTVSIDCALPISNNSTSTDSQRRTLEQLHWAKENNLRVVSGPLVTPNDVRSAQSDPSCDSFESMMENILNKVKYTVSKYHGNVQLWDACNGLSNCQSTGLDDAQSFKLACNVINLIHNLDPKTPLIFSVDIPAAENMRLNNRAINPLVFAESLIRAHDRSIAGIGLELNLNTWPNGTLPLDLPGLSDLIDHWSSQNRSLLVRLTTPLDLSSPSLQTLDYSKNQTSSIVSNWIYPVKLTATAFQDDDDDTAPEINPSQIATQPNSEKDCNAQPNLASKPMPPSGLEILQLLLAKPNVDAILWNQCQDSSEFAIPNVGLFTKDLQPRSIVECMTRLRSQYLP